MPSSPAPGRVNIAPKHHVSYLSILVSSGNFLLFYFLLFFIILFGDIFEFFVVVIYDHLCDLKKGWKFGKFPRKA